MNDLWTLIHEITEDDTGKVKLLVFHTPHGRFYVPNDGSVTRINKAGGPSPAKPWAKFFRFEPLNVDGRNIITYVENRTVDIIPVSSDRKAVFLIRRQTKGGIEGGIALPGGHIDPPELPVDAAYRELSEEVLADVDARREVAEMTCLDDLGWVAEKVAPGKVPAEHVSMTLAFVAVMKPEATLVAGDDAADGMWYDLEQIPWQDFHFLHHVDILKHWLTKL